MSSHQPQFQQNAVMFYLEQMTRKFVNDCDYAARQVEAARTMRDASHRAQVIMRGEIRPMPDARSAQQKLRSRATERMRELLKPQLEALAACQSVEEFKVARARFLQQDWNFLRGDYASVYHEATRTAEQMLGALGRAEALRGQSPVAAEEQPKPPAPSADAEPGETSPPSNAPRPRR